MSGKGWVWTGFFIGSTVGSILPYFWNGGAFSYMFWSSAGSALGIYAGFKFAKAIGAL